MAWAAVAACEGCREPRLGETVHRQTSDEKEQAKGTDVSNQLAVVRDRRTTSHGFTQPSKARQTTRRVEHSDQIDTDKFLAEDLS
jgi:hypothetical protein